MCVFRRIPANLGLGIAVLEYWDPRISVGSRKSVFFSLNYKKKGGPLLEGLT
jgi:hypothetical protein